MPLVFAVLIILVLFLNSSDFNKKRSREMSVYAKDGRKTNATLEQKIMDTYMKHGLSADEAFRKSYEDIIRAGFEPCIPRSAYGSNSSRCVLKHGFNPKDFDSFLVRDRRNDFTAEWKREHPGQDPWLHRDEIEELVYKDFPGNEYAYIRDIKRRAMKAQAKPVGTFIIYPGLGTCEILAHNWNKDVATGGTYTLRVLKNDKIVGYVKIGDKKIKSQ
jgi:hypothetical protein